MNISKIIAILAIFLLIYNYGSNYIETKERDKREKEYYQKVTPLFEQVKDLTEYEWESKCTDLSEAAKDVMKKRQENFDLNLMLDELQSPRHRPSENNVVLGYVAQAYASPIVPKEDVDEVIRNFSLQKRNECVAKLDITHITLKVDDPNELERVKKQKVLEKSAQYFLAYSEDGNQQKEIKVIAKIDLGTNGIPTNFRTLNQEIELAVKDSGDARKVYSRGRYQEKLPVKVVVVSQKERNVMIQVFSEHQNSRMVGYDLVNTVELIQDDNGELEPKK